MTGWRLAFVAGNERVVAAFAHIKDNYDSGQFKAIQKAGCTALSHPEITDAITEKYRRRLTSLVKTLKSVGFDAKMPGGSFYLYVKAPKGVKGGRAFANAEEFSEFLIKEKLISTVPWDDAGAYVRLSATFEAKGLKDEARVLEEIKSRLSGMKFVF
jgi:LL-diaminopimelate aminotransferase